MYYVKLYFSPICRNNLGKCNFFLFVTFKGSITNYKTSSQTFQNRCGYLSIDHGDFVSKYMATISFNVQYYNKAYFEQHKKL